MLVRASMPGHLMSSCCKNIIVIEKRIHKQLNERIMNAYMIFAHVTFYQGNLVTSLLC